MPPAGETGPKPLDENRYVSADGKPLAGGTTANDQFKRMPISLRLIIDQREINRLSGGVRQPPLPVEDAEAFSQSIRVAQTRDRPRARRSPNPRNKGLEPKG